MINVDWVIHDDQARTLALHDASFDGERYELPGGPVQAIESPHMTAARTARDQLGLYLVARTLLLVDAQPGLRSVGIFPYCAFVFFHQMEAGQEIPPATVDAAKRSARAQAPYVRWLTDSELDQYLSPDEALRAREAAIALEKPERRGYRFKGHALDDNAA